MLFTAGTMASVPLVDLLLLRTMGLSAVECGLADGLPCLGGIIAGTLVHRAMARWGRERTLVATGVLRTPWIAPLALVPTGWVGLAGVVALQFGLLLSVGFSNPAFNRVRMEATPERLMAPVVVAWSSVNRAVSALAAMAGGGLGTAIGIRPALVVAGVVSLTSALALVRLPHPTAPHH